METPSSTRRITRSQAKAIVISSATSNTKTSRITEDSEMGFSKSRQRTVKQDRSALIDITNDSPIVGLASGSLKETPISSVSKQKINSCKKTPGSGEALLRGQVKNLLQKVEEEAEISKFCLESCGPVHGGFKAIFNSPACLVAPTPVNTPQVLNFSVAEEFGSLSSVSEPPIEDQLNLPQVFNGVIEVKKEAECVPEVEKDLMISRTLFLDFSEKSDSSSECSSVVTYQGAISGVDKDKLAVIDDDDASVWSIQVNASTRDEDEDEDEVNQEDGGNGDEDEDEYYDDVEEEEYDVDVDDDEMLFLDELCEGISNISVVDGGEKKRATKFMGKHIKFVYNSDDELVQEYEEGEEANNDAEILRLKGLPTPKGKHVRFQEEDE